MTKKNHLLEKQKAVFSTYTERSSEVENHGERFNPLYLSYKALSDWDLFMQAKPEGQSILNVGCFEPIDELFFIELVKEWTSVDINPTAIEMAKKVAQNHLSPHLFDKLHFKVGDAMNLPFADETFDIAVSFSALEHIPGKENRQKAFNEMARVVKKGGKVIITVPNKFSFFYFVHHRNIRNGTCNYGYAHLYTKKEFKSALKEAGLEPGFFTSELQIPSSRPFWLMNLISRISCRFGDRIGFIAHKK